MNCPECSTPFKPHRVDQSYCSADCGKRARSRELNRGAIIYRALYWWRYDRYNPQTVRDNFRFICREIRAWIDEDKAANRPPPPSHRHDVDRGHQRRAVK